MFTNEIEGGVCIPRQRVHALRGTSLIRNFLPPYHPIAMPRALRWSQGGWSSRTRYACIETALQREHHRGRHAPAKSLCIHPVEWAGHKSMAMKAMGALFSEAGPSRTRSSPWPRPAMLPSQKPIFEPVYPARRVKPVRHTLVCEE